VNYLFEQKSFKLWLINAGYHSLQFTVYGLIFGLL
jgi:CRISPR/Cas system-associated protein endoribonuclease Cas2